ncbi:hypothetical protein [Candidatus Synchoanobacter obligatus]|uniref:Uncharacterized protein n=1 Tax=Candidatus Synchoanobacter obligatus TaxID=2919597 RepID=A0ABT1L542_9GAMM|nr:hypothetical protein [Candidatus Synchoanobacter obligatus]MCP8352036.1 hypothetical protein [Candidatus Synchoanobacter obligatus]
MINDGIVDGVTQDPIRDLAYALLNDTGEKNDEFYGQILALCDQGGVKLEYAMIAKLKLGVVISLDKIIEVREGKVSRDLFKNDELTDQLCWLFLTDCRLDDIYAIFREAHQCLSSYKYQETNSLLPFFVNRSYAEYMELVGRMNDSQEIAVDHPILQHLSLALEAPLSSSDFVSYFCTHSKSSSKLSTDYGNLNRLIREGNWQSILRDYSDMGKDRVLALLDCFDHEKRPDTTKSYEDFLTEYYEKIGEPYQPGLIPSWNDFPWGFSNIPDKNELLAGNVESQSRLLSHWYLTMLYANNMNFLAFAATPQLEPLSFRYVVEACLKNRKTEFFEGDVVGHLSLPQQKCIEEAYGSDQQRPRFVKIRALFLGRSPDWAAQTENALVGYFHTWCTSDLDTVKNSVERMLKSKSTRAYAALGKILGNQSYYLKQVNSQHYVPFHDTGRVVRDMLIKACNKDLVCMLWYYRLRSVMWFCAMALLWVWNSPLILCAMFPFFLSTTNHCKVVADRIKDNAACYNRSDINYSQDQGRGHSVK